MQTAQQVRSVEHDARWRRRIPLQKRVGNGAVYCSKYMPNEEAGKMLLEFAGYNCSRLR